MSKICSVDGCDRPNYAKGFCSYHYNKKRLEAKPECKVKGCAKTSSVGNLCIMHYARMKIHGSTELPKREKIIKYCSVNGCELEHKANGFCDLHNARVNRRGTVELPEKEEIRCSVDGCDGKHKGLGLCARHYKKFRWANPAKIEKCSVDGCDRKIHYNGLCRSHHRRLKVYGDTSKGQALNGAGTKFLMDSMKEETDECILWPYCKGRSGYGYVMLDGRKITAHRASLILHKGAPASEEMQACHDPIKCSSKLCINVSHLRWGTMKENLDDRLIEGSIVRGEQCLNSKLTEQDVIAIRSTKKGTRGIAKKYGVANSAISAVRSRKTWKHVT